MTFIILTTMAPLFAFYLYALVNFQKELRRVKRNKFPGGKTVPLYREGAQLSPADPSTTGAGMAPGSHAEGRTQGSDAPSNAQRQTVSTPAFWSAQATYQFDSVYLGPFLLIPVRNRKHDGAQPRVTQIAGKHVSSE